MMPNFEEWAYELADESETFTGRAEAIEAKLRQAYEAGQAHGKPEVSHSSPLAPPDRPERTSQDDFVGWTPEFTVWVVRRGSRFPMVVDSIFVDEDSARKRARVLRSKVLGGDDGWHAEKYSHLQPPGDVAVPARAHQEENEDDHARVDGVPGVGQGDLPRKYPTGDSTC